MTHGTLDLRGRPVRAGSRRGRSVGSRLALVVATLVLLAVLVALGIGWYFSNMATAVSHGTRYPLHVLSVSLGSRPSVTISRSTDAARPATFGLTWPGGRAVVGPPIAATASAVTRPLSALAGAPLRPGARVALDTGIRTGDPASADSLRFTDVSIPTELGSAPAWLVPGRGAAAATWVVAVHGHGASREETLRALPILHAAGLTALAITYRNDVDAPRSPDGRDHLGASEWRDVDAAVGYALAQHAHRVLLYGWSMGGGMTLSEARFGSHRSAVAGLVLDAPALDWRSILDHQGGTRGLPLVETRVAEQIVAWRVGLDYARFDHVAHARDLAVPVLLVVGSADDYVPPQPAYRLAAARPDLVRLIVVRGAGHTQAYNVDPVRYRAALTSFLARLG